MPPSSGAAVAPGMLVLRVVDDPATSVSGGLCSFRSILNVWRSRGVFTFGSALAAPRHLVHDSERPGSSDHDFASFRPKVNMLASFRAPCAARSSCLLGSTLLLLLFALAGCGGKEGAANAGAPGGRGGPGKGAPGEGAGESETIPVAVEPAVIGVASSTYTTTAVLEAENHAEIRARTTGVVRSLLREEGDLVQEGQDLLLLEDDEARLRVRQAEANLDKSRSEHARGASMRDGGMLSDQEFDALKNTLDVRESELELAKLELSYTRVTSPLTGRVVRRHVDLGTHISPGTILAEVMDVTPLLALVHVPANRMGFVAVGQRVKLGLNSNDTQLEGVVRLVSPIVDPQTGTVKVTVEIRSYPPATRPGDFAEVRIVTARHDNATLVPSRAIFEEQGQSILYVTEGGKAVRRVVKSGFVDGDATEILEGVAPQELVVIKGQRDLRDAVRVEVLEGPPGTVAAAAADAEKVAGSGAPSATNAEKVAGGAPAKSTPDSSGADSTKAAATS